MLLFILADEFDLLTTLGRIAALVLIIYVFLFALLFFVGSLLLLYGNAWLRDKIGLVHQVRTIVESIDTTLHAPTSESLPKTLEPENRLGQALQAIHTAQAMQVIQVAKNAQKQVDNIDQKVEPVADRIAEGVIEFRARTVMAQSMLKAFFLPGLVKLKPRSPLLLPEAVDVARSSTIEVSEESSSLHDGSSNVVVSQFNSADENVYTSVGQETQRSESEGTE